MATDIFHPASRVSPNKIILKYYLHILGSQNVQQQDQDLQPVQNDQSLHNASLCLSKMLTAKVKENESN